MKKVVFGCGGQARSIINTLLKKNEYEEIILVDGNVYKDEIIMGVAALNHYQLEKEDAYIIAIGDNDRRSKLYGELQSDNCGEAVSIVSDSALIGVETRIGTGTFIAPSAYIGPQVRVGDDSIINTGSIIEHETIVGNHTHIAPHATICGRCRIGNHVFCGAGSIVIDKVNIGDHVTVGAGAVVISDISEAGTYVGVPAKKVR